MGVEEILREAERALAPVWRTSVHLHSPQVLPGSHRATVVSAVVSPGTAQDVFLPASVIVKVHQRDEAGDAVVREPAALQLLSNLGDEQAPGLLAFNTQLDLLVMEDLGKAGSLADLLLGSDPAQAETAVLSWAEALGRLHGATVSTGDLFATALAGQAEFRRVTVPPVDTMPGLLARAADELSHTCQVLGLEAPRARLAAAAEELSGAADVLGGSAHALTPGDACPDNNVLGSRMRLIDFEHAQYRHVAWDVAYLTVPWPTCWCHWRIPADLAERALRLWRWTVQPSLPYVDTTPFQQDCVLATTAWAMSSIIWFVPDALEADSTMLLDPPSPASPATPPIMATIQHRLGLAAEAGARVLPAISWLAGEMLLAARREWGEMVLETAPAFR